MLSFVEGDRPVPPELSLAAIGQVVLSPCHHCRVCPVEQFCPGDLFRQVVQNADHPHGIDDGAELRILGVIVEQVVVGESIPTQPFPSVRIGGVVPHPRSGGSDPDLGTGFGNGGDEVRGAGEDRHGPLLAALPERKLGLSVLGSGEAQEVLPVARTIPAVRQEPAEVPLAEGPQVLVIVAEGSVQVYGHDRRQNPMTVGTFHTPASVRRMSLAMSKASWMSIPFCHMPYLPRGTN